MFYNKTLMNGVLRNAWLKGNDQESSEATDIAHICSEVSARLAHPSARHRLSLRSSAVLLSGTTRIYHEELDSLYADCVALDSIMIRRRRDASEVSRSEDSLISSHHSRDNGHRRVCSPESRTSSPEDDRSENVGMGTDDCENSAGSENRTRSENPHSGDSNHSRNSRRREKGTQTSRSYMRRVFFDRSLPVGVMKIYDGESRTPVGVICSNLNPDIRRFYGRL